MNEETRINGLHTHMHKAGKNYTLKFSASDILAIFSSVQSLSCVQPFVTPWTAAHQSCLSITNSWSLLKLMSIKLVMPSNHLILCHPLLLPPSIFPSIRVFSNESVLHIRWSKYWSFSISPSNEYSGLISFRIDCLISLLSKGLSRVFSNTTIKSINSSVLSFLYGPTLTSIHRYWVNHSFDYVDLCWQSNISAFLKKIILIGG